MNFKLDILLGTEKLDDIRKRANDIIGSDSGEADKQQALFDLAKKIGLPIDSSDVHCRRLSYPEMYDRINDWIKDHRSEKYTKINICTALISALMAVIAVSVSVLIHWQTRQMLAPTERPTISTVDSKCKGTVDNDTGILTITLSTVFKNVGNHPAINLRVRVWGAPLDEPNDLTQSRDVTLADPIYPEIQVTLSNSITFNINNLDRFKEQRKKYFLFVRMDYSDAFDGKTYYQGYNMVYEIGKSVISGATIEERKPFNSSLKKAGAIKN